MKPKLYFSLNGNTAALRQFHLHLDENIISEILLSTVSSNTYPVKPKLGKRIGGRDVKLLIRKFCNRKGK